MLRLRQRVPRLADAEDGAIADGATVADARVCLAREYGFRTWDELAEATDRARDTHYSRLPRELPWKRAEAAIRAGDAAALRALLDAHPGLEHEDPGMTLIVAAAQPRGAAACPREVVDVLLEAGSRARRGAQHRRVLRQGRAGRLAPRRGRRPARRGRGLAAAERRLPRRPRAAADVLVARTGIVPDAFYLAAAAGDLDRLARWFDDAARLRPEAGEQRPNLSDVGWPGRAIVDDLDDVLAEAPRARRPPRPHARRARSCSSAAPTSPARRCTA